MGGDGGNDALSLNPSSPALASPSVTMVSNSSHGNTEEDEEMHRNVVVHIPTFPNVIIPDGDPNLHGASSQVPNSSHSAQYIEPNYIGPVNSPNSVNSSNSPDFEQGDFALKRRRTKIKKEKTPNPIPPFNQAHHFQSSPRASSSIDLNRDIVASHL